MNDKFTVLISSAGRRVSLLRSFRAALIEEVGATGRIVTTDVSNLAAAAWESDQHFLVPRCTEAEFVPAMLRLCREVSVDLLVPTIDTELYPLSENRDRFEAVGTRVLISDPPVIEIANDKVLTNAFFRMHHIPTVRQTRPTEMLNELTSWQFPVIAKPRRGSAGIGLKIIDTPDQVSDLGRDYIIQEIAGGNEYTMDILLGKSGASRVIVPRLRLETRGGEVSKGRTERVPRLRTVVEDLCRQLPGARGVLTVQAFYDAVGGEVKVIEINPRFGGGYPLSYAAGADFPRWLLQEQLERPVQASDFAWSGGMTMLRYDDAVFIPAGKCLPTTSNR